MRILDADKRINIIGIDNEERTINQARTALREYGDRVYLEKFDLLKALYKMPNESVDIFASVWLIHNLDPEYRKKLYHEISRVLKIGALFVNGDKYARNDQKAHNQDLENQIRAFDIFDSLGRPHLKKEWTLHYREDEKIKITEAEQIKILKNLDFDSVDITYRKGMEAIIRAVR